MSSLYIVATPIGNLDDISQRALRILSGADLILCEDTRVTRKLLERYQISTPLLSYHQHSKLKKIDYILGLLNKGKNLALVSDAGTPGISDPGNKLICAIIEYFRLEHFRHLTNTENKSHGIYFKYLDEKVKIVPIPGPSALAAAASICGFPMDRFLFLGFPPQKKKRKKFFDEIVNSKYPVIFYESPYRILRTLKELGSFEKEPSSLHSLQLVVGRELTKKFETIYRGTVKGVLEQIQKDPIKGEFVVIVKGKK